VEWCITHRPITLGMAGLAGVLTLYLALGGVIGSEYPRHLVEGAIWARGTLDPSTGPTEGTRGMIQPR